VAALLRFFLPSRSATVQRRVWLLVVADGAAQVALAVLRAAAMAEMEEEAGIGMRRGGVTNRCRCVLREKMDAMVGRRGGCGTWVL